MISARLRAALLAAAAAAVACGRGTPAPAPLDTRSESCRFCRMAVSDARFAAQIVARGEEPLFFDDIGCLDAYLRQAPRLPDDALAYVADHRTRAWVPASAAVFTRVVTLETPMNSHLLAHADASSRDADPAAAGGQIVIAAAWRGGGAALPAAGDERGASPAERHR